MPTFRTGTVEALVSSNAHMQRLSVRVDDSVREAVLYTRWAAPASIGDQVVVNTTAVDLDLGTGGADFVVWNLAVDSYDAPGGGHIMKLRYTPAQCEVLAVEAQESEHHELMSNASSLEDTPVVATSLHSQLLPVLCGVRESSVTSRVAYVMTDGAALEASFSHTARRLRELGWLAGIVTVGHAVGGDLEAVSLHSGLLAAVHVLQADIVIAGPGPGVVGTGTPYGTTALDLGTIVLVTLALRGRAVVCVRISEADHRERHRGLSHHVVAALDWARREVAETRACVVVPPGWGKEVGTALSPWMVREHSSGVLQSLATAAGDGLIGSHMGRDPTQDSVFFEAAGAAGSFAGRMLNT